jgi:hypothetical protein
MDVTLRHRSKCGRSSECAPSRPHLNLGIPCYVTAECAGVDPAFGWRCRSKRVESCSFPIVWTLQSVGSTSGTVRSVLLDFSGRKLTESVGQHEEFLTCRTKRTTIHMRRSCGGQSVKNWRNLERSNSLSYTGGPQLTNGLRSKFPFVSRLFGTRNRCAQVRGERPRGDTHVRSVNNCSQVRVSARRPPVRKCGCW